LRELHVRLSADRDQQQVTRYDLVREVYRHDTAAVAQDRLHNGSQADINTLGGVN